MLGRYISKDIGVAGVAADKRLRLASVGLLGRGVVHELLWPNKTASFAFAPGNDFFRLNLYQDQFRL